MDPVGFQIGYFETVEEEPEEIVNYISTGSITADGGTFDGPSGKETWYNRSMKHCITSLGFSMDDYYVDGRGIKMLGDYVLCAADTQLYSKGSIILTSVGEAIVVDHCEAGNIDICVDW